jgi:type III secretion protein S
MEIFATTFKTAIFQSSYHALIMILIISGPPIIVASVLGLFVAIIQSATQIQEQTFSFAIKLVAVIGTIMMMGGWIGGMIMQFALEIFTNFYRLKL